MPERGDNPVSLSLCPRPIFAPSEEATEVSMQQEGICKGFVFFFLVVLLGLQNLSSLTTAEP